MSSQKISYTIVQFSPKPERFEFVNVGVVVFNRQNTQIVHKTISNFSRVKRLFEDANTGFLSVALEDFIKQANYEFRKHCFKVSAAEFNSKRIGLFQITPVMPAHGHDPWEVAKRLFSELVSEKPSRKKVARIDSRLADAFRDAGVLSLLERRPDAVHIERFGVSVKAAFGYRNGIYNLIDAARFDEPERGLAEAGKRVLEGRALAETLQHKLVVVGDFGDRPKSFVDNLREEFVGVGAKLFRLDEIGVLASEIRRAAH